MTRHTSGPSLPRLLARTARQASRGPRPAGDEGEEERRCCRCRTHAGGGAVDQPHPPLCRRCRWRGNGADGEG